MDTNEEKTKVVTAFSRMSPSQIRAILPVLPLQETLLPAGQMLMGRCIVRCSLCCGVFTLDERKFFSCDVSVGDVLYAHGWVFVDEHHTCVDCVRDQRVRISNGGE